MNPFKRALLCAMVAGAALMLGTGCDAVQQDEPEAPLQHDATDALSKTEALGGGRVVVANRASGTLSVIDRRTDAVVATIPLPPGPNPPEPMYVVYTPVRDRVFVGDRANDRVVAFDARTLQVEGTVPATGIFHMWADLPGRQLWVVDNVNHAITVIDPRRLTVLATVPVAGGTPHDVIVDPLGRFAFVSVFVGGDADPDQVVKYSTRTFAEVGRTDVGEDPHLSMAWPRGRLYVPTQGADAVVVLDARTLAEVDRIPVPNAHGAGMALGGRVFYTTNIADGGTDGLFAIDTRANTVAGSVDTPFPGPPLPTPHNIALTPNRKKIYVTHSGATANQVTIYTTHGRHPVPVSAVTVEVGLNPFGLAYVP